MSDHQPRRLTNRLFRRQTANVVAAISQVATDAIVIVSVYSVALKHCGVESLGLWAFVLAWMTFSRVAAVFITPVVVRFTAISVSSNDPLQAARVILGGISRVTIRVGFVSPGIIASLILYVSYIESFADTRTVVQLAVMAWVYVTVLALSGIALSALDGLSRTYLRSMAALTASIARILITMALIKPWGVAGFAAGLITQALVSLLIGGFWIGYELRRVKVSDLRSGDFWTKEMIDFGRSYQSAGVYQMLLEPSTRIVLPFFADLGTLGYFDMVSKFITQVRTAVVSPLALLLPRFSALHHTSVSVLRGLYQRCSLAGFIFTSLSFSLLTCLLPLISRLLLGEYNQQFVLFGTLLSVAWAMNAYSSIAYYLLLAAGKLKQINRGALAMAVLNVAGGILGGVVGGGLGCVIAFSFAIFIGSLLFILEADRDEKKSERGNMPIWAWLASLSAFVVSASTLLGVTPESQMHSELTMLIGTTLTLGYSLVIHGAIVFLITRSINYTAQSSASA